MVSRIQLRESSFFKCTWRQTEVVIIQATVPIMWLCAIEESLGVSFILQCNNSLLPLGIFSSSG